MREQDEGDVRVGQQVEGLLADVHAARRGSAGRTACGSGGPRGVEAPRRRPGGRVSICGEQRCAGIRGDEVDDRRRHGRRSAAEAFALAAVAHRRLGPVGVTAVRLGQVADDGRVRVVDLLRQRVGQLRAAAARRPMPRRCGRWRHGGHVAGEGDEGRGARRLRAPVGRHVGDDRDRAAQDRLHDPHPCWSARRRASRSRG